MKKFSVILFLLIFASLTAVGSVCVAEEQPSVQNDTAIVSQRAVAVPYGVSVQTEISSIPYRSDKTEKIKVAESVLEKAGVSSEIVGSLADDNLAHIADADKIMLTSSTIWGDAMVEEGSQIYHDGDFTIYNVLLNYGETAYINTKQYDVFEFQLWAMYSVPPFYRLTDMLVATVSNQAFFGDIEERAGSALLYFDSYINGVTSETYNLYDGSSDSLIHEYSNPGFFGMTIDMPIDIYDNNALRVKVCSLMFFTLSGTIYTPHNEVFQLYGAYGHRYLEITQGISVSSAPGAVISFTNMTDHMQAPALSSFA